MLNPIHTAIDDPRAYAVYGTVIARDHCKAGGHTFVCGQRLDLPQISIDMRVRFGILAALQTYSEPVWVAWANNWLGGIDRAREAAWAASSEATRRATSDSERRYGRAAYEAAYAAANAAGARAAYAVAYEAARAAGWAAAVPDINLSKLALQAIQEEQS
jgi:hypothetical protein